MVTAAGLHRLDETLPGHLQIIEQWFTGQLDPEALAALLDGLRRVRDAVHPGATAGSTDADAGADRRRRPPPDAPLAPAPARRARRHRQKDRQN